MNISLADLEVTRFFWALIILLSSAHIFGYLFDKFKLPRVIGEICGGLLLGPTFLGYFFPESYAWLFKAFEGEGKLLAGIYWLGLMLLMFISGFEIQRSFDKDDKKIISAILAGGTLIPFIAGWFVPDFYNVSGLMGKVNNALALQIVISIAIAVTSIPVISKIFIDLNIIKTRFAKIIIATATLEDILLWIALAVATGLVSSTKVSTTTIIQTVAVSILFLLFGVFFVPKVFAWITRSKFNFLAQSNVVAYILLVGLLMTGLASLLHVNAIFGALIAGMTIGQQIGEKFETARATIKQFSLAFFIPIYFAVVGIKLDLIHHFDLMFFIGFIVFAVVCKFIGVFFSAQSIGKDTLSSLNLSVAMNARGGPGIVLATVALDLGIISESFFSSLVMLAIVTSLLAGYWFRYVLGKKWRLLS